MLIVANVGRAKECAVDAPLRMVLVDDINHDVRQNVADCAAAETTIETFQNLFGAIEFDAERNPIHVRRKQGNGLLVLVMIDVIIVLADELLALHLDLAF